MPGHAFHNGISVSVCMIAALVLLFAPLMVSASSDLEAYEACLASGDFAGAAEKGASHYLTLKSQPADPAAFESSDNRLSALSEAQALAVYKLREITSSVSLRRKSPFLYVVPTPTRFYHQTLVAFSATRVSTRKLDDQSAVFVASYMEFRQELADRSVLETFVSLAATGASQETAMGRAYMSAYMAATHDKVTWPVALQLLAQYVTGGEMPVFLVEDLLGALENPDGAWLVIKVLDEITWLKWPEASRMRALMHLAALAESKRSKELVILANSEIAVSASPSEGEKVLMKLIRDLAEEFEEYEAAAMTCADYLRRFPEGKNTVTVMYLKALYEYRAGMFNSALADIAAFKNKYPRARLIPEMMILEGICQIKKGKHDEAIKVFKNVANEYAAQPIGGRALFMLGHTYLSLQKYAEAQEAFIRLVDFYPEDPNVPNAKEYLAQLEDLRASK